MDGCRAGYSLSRVGGGFGGYVAGGTKGVGGFLLQMERWILDDEGSGKSKRRGLLLSLF